MRRSDHRRLASAFALALVVGATAGCPRDRETSRTQRASDGPRASPGPVASDRTDPGPGPDWAKDTDATREKRAALVRSIAQSGEVKDGRVLDAMGRVRRHVFMPGATPEDAYADRAMPIGLGQTISQPTIVAEMTEALELHGTERVLEIGTGSGYQAAVLSLLAREVYSIEIIRALADKARMRLEALGYTNVHVMHGDGYAGDPPHAPFERIILTAAPPTIPQALLDQLAEGGVMVAPEGVLGEQQWLLRIRKKAGSITREKLDSVRFLPMVPGAARDR